MKHMNLMLVAGAIVALPLLASARSEAKSPPAVWLASDLVGMKVVDKQGESLGKIEDVVVHPGGEASYAVLSFGGVLGMGDKLFAMPWSVLRAVEPNTAKKDSADSLVLPLDKERLKAAPGFDKKNWPTIANPDWTKEIDSYYAKDLKSNTKQPVEAAARTSVITWKVSELKGANVMTPTGEKLGDLKELAIDTNGRVNYVAVSVGGFLGLGDKLVAVPWGSLTFSLAGDKSDKRLISLASTKKHLEQAPEFKEGKENTTLMSEPKYISRLYDYYSCPVYWTSTPAPAGTQSPKD